MHGQNEAEVSKTSINGSPQILYRKPPGRANIQRLGWVGVACTTETRSAPQNQIHRPSILNTYSTKRTPQGDALQTASIQGREMHCACTIHWRASEEPHIEVAHAPRHAHPHTHSVCVWMTDLKPTQLPHATPRHVAARNRPDCSSRSMNTRAISLIVGILLPNAHACTLHIPASPTRLASSKPHPASPHTP
jgi:hypothetical protein